MLIFSLYSKVKYYFQLNEWIQEKSIIAQDETYRSAKTIHSKWMRHQAFEAEVASNKNRLYQVEQVSYCIKNNLYQLWY